MTAAIEVVSPGLLTTVQDLGRWGHQSRGVSVAGPMDVFAHRLANVLVANERRAATLEVTLAGPTVVFQDVRTFAVTGAEFTLMLDERPVPMYSRVDAAPGSVLRFGERRAGARAYLAVDGGFDAPLVLDSRATHVPTGTGGWHGRALRRGDVLPVGPHGRHRTTPRLGSFADRWHPSPAGVLLRVLSGPHAGRFGADTFSRFIESRYTVDPASNRMGYRLVGPPVAPLVSADLISEPTPIGTVQVPASGQPVLLMADRQTMGGYAKIATVISADIGVAAQAAPGDAIRFVKCTPADAHAALTTLEQPLLAVEARLA